MLKSKRLFCVLLLFVCLVVSAFARGVQDDSIVIASKNLKLAVFENTGSFCLYKITDVNKCMCLPLYDDRAMASANYYTMRFDGITYRLRKEIGRSVTVENLGNAISIKFDISDKFSVEQVLSFTTESYKTSGSLLKITTTITNNTEGPVPVALKSLFDPILGEQRRISLYTDAQNAIFSETRIVPAESKDTYIASSNSSLACLFFIKNEEQTAPEDIYIENWEYLQTSRWVPRHINGRSFSTKNYTNDSAIMMLWGEKEINPGGKYTVTNLIGLNDFLHVTEELPRETVEKHLETLTVEERKNYDHIIELLEELKQVEANPDDYTDEDLLALIERIETAMKEMQE